MTQTELLNTIRAEIKRLDEKYRTIRVNGTLQQAKEADRVVSVLHDLRVFLDNLEKPAANFEKELKDYCRKYYNYDYPKQYTEKTGADIMDHIIEAARHFYSLRGQEEPEIPINQEPEVDLEKEISRWVIEDCGPSDFDPYTDHWCADDIQRTARHFYELGKTQG